MQEGGALEADVDEGRLHAGQHPRHAAQVHVADQAAGGGALDVQLLHRALLDDGDPGLVRGVVDEDLFGHRVAGGGLPSSRSSCAVSYKGRPMIPEWLPSIRRTKRATAPWIA